jgi:CRP-like cAMP-binding protein
MIYRGSDPACDGLQRRRAVLSHATLLRDGTPLEIETLARYTAVHTHRAGSELIAQDAAATAIFFIGYGRVRLTLLGDSGRQLTVCDLDRGDSFGESAILEGGRYSTGAVALEEVFLLAVPRDAFVAYAQRHPAAAFRLAVEQTQRLSTANQQLAEMAMSSVEARVAHTLKRLADHDGIAVSTGVLLRRRVTHQELAQMAGTSRETVTRTVAGMSRRGLVVAREGRIVLTPALLAQP